MSLREIETVRKTSPVGEVQSQLPNSRFYVGLPVKQASIFLKLLMVCILLVSCDDETAAELTPSATIPTVVATAEAVQEATSAIVETVEEPTAAPTPVPPTATPEPMAASVNGRPILLSDFQKEAARYQQAQEELGLVAEGESQDYTEVVLTALIETEIIAQAAEAEGIVVTDQAVSDRIIELKEAVGGEDKFAAWLAANQWVEEEFHQALKAEMVTERMVALVTAGVPFTAEHAHARYLQVDDPALAQSLLEQVQGGADFETLARQHSRDRVTGEDGGDLGFFARGTLLVPEVEQASFALDPGQLSDVITAPRSDGSGTAYYLVLLIEKDPQRELDPYLRSIMLQETFEGWLAEQRDRAEIIRFVGENL